MNHSRLLAALCILLLSSFPLQSSAQEKKNLLDFTIGGEFIPSNSLAADVGTGSREIRYSSSMSLELNYGRQLYQFHRSELWLDVPALVGPNHRIANGDALLPTSNATFYVTPSARLAFPSAHGLTPWVSLGGGYGLFETSDYFAGGANNPTIHTHTGVLQFGGGVDVKTPLRLLVPIGLRGEFRDFYALREPIFPVPVTGQSQHGLTFGGGITARF